MGQKMTVKVEGIGNGMRTDSVAGKHKIAIDEPYQWVVKILLLIHFRLF